MADAQAAPLRQRREAFVYFDAGSHPTSPKSPGSFPAHADSENDGFHDLIASTLEPLPDECSIFACLSPARPRREATTLDNSGSGAFPAVSIFSASSTGSQNGSEPVRRRRRAAEPLDSIGSGNITADLHGPQGADADADAAIVARPSVIIQEEVESAVAVEVEPERASSRDSLVVISEEDTA